MIETHARPEASANGGAEWSLPEEALSSLVVAYVSPTHVLPPDARAQLLQQHLAQAEADLFAAELQLLRITANVEEGRVQMKRLREVAETLI